MPAMLCGLYDMPCPTQATFMSTDEVSEAAVYACTGNPLHKDIGAIVTSLLNDDFLDVSASVAAMQVAKGLALTDIVQQLHSCEFPPSILAACWASSLFKSILANPQMYGRRKMRAVVAMQAKFTSLRSQRHSAADYHMIRGEGLIRYGAKRDIIKLGASILVVGHGQRLCDVPVLAQPDVVQAAREARRGIGHHRFPAQSHVKLCEAGFKHALTWNALPAYCMLGKQKHIRHITYGSSLAWAACLPLAAKYALCSRSPLVIAGATSAAPLLVAAWSWCAALR